MIMLTSCLEYRKKCKARIEEHDRVSYQEPLVLHLQDRHKDARCGVRAPNNTRYAQDVSYERIEVECYTEEGCQDERKKAVA